MKLKLDFLLKQCRLASGDVVKVNGDIVNVTPINVHVLNTPTPDSYLITAESFGYRGRVDKWIADDTPVDTGTGILAANKVQWDKVISWKPCMHGLIEMQIEHDAKQDHASENLLEAVLEIDTMKSQLVFTKECKELIGKPDVDMLCKIEHMCQSRDRLVIDEVIFKFEGEKDYCAVGLDTFCFGIEKEHFIAWHPIDDRSNDEIEMDEAKCKQVDLTVNDIMTASNLKYNEAHRLAQWLQLQGGLAEIILPLKSTQ